MSKKSDSMKLMTDQHGREKPQLGEEAEAELADQREVGPGQRFRWQLGHIARYEKGDDRGDQDAGEDGGGNAARHQDDGDRQSDHGHENRPGVQGRQGQEAIDGSGLPGNEGDHAGVAQPDEQDEEPDADGDRPAERGWDDVHDVLAHAEQDQDRDQHALGDDDPHRLRRGEPQRADEVVGDDGVEPQTRSEGEGPVRVEPHGDGEEPGDQTGRGRHRAHVESGRGEHGPG